MPHDPSFETGLVKVPFEALRRTTRDRKYALDDVASVTAALASAAGADPPPGAAAAAAALDGAHARLVSLKRKLAAVAEAEAEAAACLRLRLAHVAASGGATPARGRATEWTAARADRVVADDLARRGRPRAAAALVQEAGLEGLVDLPALADGAAAAAAVARGDPVPALAWCDAHAARLAKLKSPLPFRLRLQQVIELARAGDAAAALAHARAHVAPLAAPWLGELQRAIAAAAFGAAAAAAKTRTAAAAGVPPAVAERYADVLAPARWADLADLVTAEVARVHAMPPASQLWTQLEAGLLALKLPAGAPAADAADAPPPPPPSSADPLASPALAALAAPLPAARRLHSQLVCGLTGKVMDDADPPAVLPSGAVYSASGLRAAAVDGVVTDPETGERVPLDALRRAFVS